QLGVLAAALLTFAMVVLPPFAGYVADRQLGRTAGRAASLAAELAANLGPDAAWGRALDVLSGALAELRTAEHAFAVRYWWGPYAASELSTTLESSYLERTRLRVVATVQEQLVADVRAIADVAEFDAAGFDVACEQLELYLMLSHPE